MTTEPELPSHANSVLDILTTIRSRDEPTEAIKRALHVYGLACYEAGIAQDRAARAQAEPVARVVRRCNPRPILPATMRLDWLPSADALPDGEYGLYAAPVMPASWVPCTITYVEGEDPEEVAFGPQRMMDRLKKWLTSYFEHVYAERYPAARAQGAGEAVAASQDAEMLHGAHEVIRIWNERARKFGFDGVAGMLNAFRHGEAGSTAPTIPQAAEVPGFVLVPREPTSAMQRAAEEAYRAWSAAEVPDSTFMHSDSYRAMIAAAPTPTASAPKAEGEARLWLWKNGDHYLAFEHLYPCFTPGGDPMTLGEPAGVAIFKRSFDRKADRTREGGDVIYQNAGWVDFNEYQSFKACRSDRITLWTDNKGGMMPLYQQFGTTTSEGAK